MQLDCIGFCGVDDSVDLQALCDLSVEHPYIEWGILLRPDKQGLPRYAGAHALEELGRMVSSCAEAGATLRVAAHFCGADCIRALSGDVAHVCRIREVIGFRRMQINPTAANEAGGWEPAPAAEGLRAVAAALADVELILQVNDETQELARHLFYDPERPAPPNFAALLDASCGLGVAPAAHPSPLPGVRCGFAGGMGPDTVLAQLVKVSAACEGQPECTTWIDMESGVRGRDAAGADIFDLARVRRVLDLVVAEGYLEGLQGSNEPAPELIEVAVSLATSETRRGKGKAGVANAGENREKLDDRVPKSGKVKGKGGMETSGKSQEKPDDSVPKSGAGKGKSKSRRWVSSRI